jgi:uncharacterized protein (DUF2062 family)
MCVAVGVTFGIFPVLGSTTLLCIIIGFFGRLNQPALQLVNYAMYPVHLALILPFFRFGDWLFGVPPLPLTRSELSVLLHSSLGNVIHVLWETTLRAVVAWSLVAPFVAGAVYALMLPVFRRAVLKKAIEDVR